MWQMEQAVLTELVGTLDAERVVDFACGTGRIADALAKAMPQSQVVGVDIAETMVKVARKEYPEVAFALLDAGSLLAYFGAASVDLVTAFRFFANADPRLRSTVASEVSAVVRPGGHVIINNHRNFWSSSYVARRARPGARAPGALNRHLLGVFQRAGFDVVTKRSLGILPQSDDRSYLLSWRRASKVEWWNCRRISSLHTIGYNTIWLLRRRG